ncbi:hypothetical protein [Candidatus Poriferisodalis sp.]|uniref:hypothetical protein n=1 Tax=Candidatus Poriferisodalis sp. TaxID=3101277 RepID=UPI003B024587
MEDDPCGAAPSFGVGHVQGAGRNDHGQSTPPHGRFSTLHVGPGHACAQRLDRTIVRWGDTARGEAALPQGRLASIEYGKGFGCGLRDNDTIVRWGADDHGQATPPHETPAADENDG